MSTIEKALKHVTEVNDSVETLERQHATLISKLDTMLPVEAAAREQLHVMADKVRSRLIAARVFERLELAPRELSLEVLRWRHSQRKAINVRRRLPIPVFALVPISDGKMQFSKPSAYSYANTNVADLRGHYADVTSEIANHYEYEVSLEWQFPGIVPDESKRVIQRAEKEFDQVLLLAEAPFDTWSFQLKRVIPRIDLDPLVLGRVGGRLFVLDVFNPTTLEQYVGEEFTK